jgi:ADP-ribose pyrophosphatase YjhB (NUDIX family)
VETSGRAVVFDRIVKDGSKTSLHVVYVDFVARVTGGELMASSDVGIARWFSREELGERWDELHEDTQRLIKESGILDKGVALVV